MQVEKGVIAFFTSLRSRDASLSDVKFFELVCSKLKSSHMIDVLVSVIVCNSLYNISPYSHVVVEGRRIVSTIMYIFIYFNLHIYSLVR